MRTMLSVFLGLKQETTRTAVCNYLASEVEALDDRAFQTFRNEDVKQHPKQRTGTVSPINHSNRHFLEAQVQLQHLCHRHFNSHSNQHQLQGNTSQRLRCQQASPSNPLGRAKWQPKDNSHPEAADFLPSG